MSPTFMGLTHIAGAIGLSLAAAMGVGPLSAVAQNGSLQGRVVDIHGVPLSGVEVTLSVAGLRATTSDSGHFLLSVPRGTHRISFRRLGFAPVVDSVTVADDDMIARQFVLRTTVVSLDPVLVTRPVSANMRRFEDRMATQQGAFITWDDMKRDETKPLRSVLARRLPGVSFVGYRGALFAASRRGNTAMDRQTRVRAVIADIRSPVACFLQIYLDGTRLYAPNGISDAVNLNDFQTRDLEAIEFYSGSANTPPEFGSSWAFCGTLVFWTRLP
jgi:hypothetical protein